MLLGNKKQTVSILKLRREILDSRSESETNDYFYKASRSERNESLLSISERRRRLVENIEDILYNEEFDPGSG